MSRVALIDYDRGNLLSVERALSYSGADVDITDDPDRVATAERVVLPGVGAFGDAMDGLRERGLIGPIRQFVASGRPFLGVCVGMQLMFNEGEEFGTHEGLGLLPGRVVAIPAKAADGSNQKIPHIGWNKLCPTRCDDFQGNALLGGIGNTPYTYFVHSFMALPSDKTDRVADCDYNGINICAAVNRNNIWGCQFHPEKSGEVGLRILQNFITMGWQN